MLYGTSLSKEGVFKVGRVLGATASIFLSIVLGAVALAVVAVEFPGIMATLQSGAGTLRDIITQTDLDDKYNIWLTFLVDDRQLVFMEFVIATRVILAMVFGGIGGDVWRSQILECSKT